MHSSARPRPRARRLLLGLSVAACLGVPAAARAGSALSVPIPPQFGEIGAATYDEQGDRVGPAFMRIDRLEDGRVRIDASTGIEGAERTVVTALLTPTEDGSMLRPLSQESRSFDAKGIPLGLMSIDHEQGRASCFTPGDDGLEPESLALPARERVANILLNLVFEPLVRGTTEKLDFQIFVCRGGPKVMEGRASVAGTRRAASSDGGRLVEVRYGVDLGPVLSRLARPFLPRLSSWFDPTTTDPWVGHRMPLFASGPTVLIVRSGVPAKLLTQTP